MRVLEDLGIRRPGTLNSGNIQDEAGVDGILGISAYADRGLAAIGSAHQIALNANREAIKIMREVYHHCGVPFPSEEQLCYLDGSNDETVHAIMNREFAQVDSHIKQHGIHTYQPFIYSVGSQSFAERAKLSHRTTSETANRINNKAIVQADLRKLGVLVPEGRLVRSIQEAMEFVDMLANQGYESVGIKLTRAASGMGVFETKTAEILDGSNTTLQKYEDELTQNGLLIDGWIEGQIQGSPNIQFWIGDSPEDDIYICASNQLLKADEIGGKGKIHIGNISAPSLLGYSNLDEACKIIRNYCRESGYRGVIGIDFLHVIVNGEHLFFFMEINGRLNGSTTGGVIGGVTSAPFWGVNNGIQTSLSPSSFMDKIASKGLLYNPESMRGVLPTNLSTLTDFGKGMVYVSGNSRHEVEDLLEEMQNL